MQRIVAFFAVVLCGLVCSSARGAEPVIDDFNYADNRTVRRLWRPNSGTAEATVAEIGGRKVLKMPCNFKGTKIERASWDRAVKLDLTACRGLQFSFFCRNPLPVSGFNFYLRSGGGWYTAEFGGDGSAGWTTVEIDKAETIIEGRPAGWGKVDMIRISAWRGADVDTAFYIADLCLLGDDSPIAIVRGESAAASRPGELGSVIRYAKNIARCMEDAGVPYCLLSDLDLTAARLKSKKLVILPHNPGMTDSACDSIEKFLGSGGKMICFYTLPPGLEEVAGIKCGGHVQQTYPGCFASIRAARDKLAGMPPVVRQESWNISRAVPVARRSRTAAYWYDDKGQSTGEPAVVVSDNCIQMTHVLLSDDPAGTESLLLAMAGHFLPGVWELSARASIARIGRFGPYRGAHEVEASLMGKAGRGSATMSILEQAAETAGAAQRLFAAGRFAEAIASAREARRLMIQAYCAAQAPEKKGERRLFWCHRAFGVAGMEWDEAIKILADNGFTAIMPNMLWGGTAYYASDVLPVSPTVREKGDQIAKCLAACRKYGIECHVWKVNWNFGGRASNEFVERMKREGRLQVDAGGKTMEDWLCPSHPANQKLEIDSMVEVVWKYDIDGVHFDYMRYPGRDSCFCSGCRQRFEAGIGTKIKHWPADVRENGKLRSQWLDFRRRNITAVVEAVSKAARKIRPGVKISAAVFKDWPGCRDNVGQDWKYWCDKGYLDFVCPMDYADNNTQFQNMVSGQLRPAGKVPCYPGIGLSTWPASDRICKLIDQVLITRQVGTGGFAVFEYDEPSAGEIVPLCGLGITRQSPSR